jgi:1-acyl-sn-glycerol-3-phosphate acyltransferase
LIDTPAPPLAVGPAAGPVELRELPVKLQGSAVAHAVLRLVGWRVRFDGLPAAQGVAIVYPHTSNWDFPIGVLAKWAIGIQVTFWAKDSLFRVPLLGRWARAIGGVPVDRSAARGIVGQMAASLRAAREQGRFMWLALAPEGTRSRTEGWRSGFYQVAVQAQVPVSLVTFDFARREVAFLKHLMMSGDAAADMAAIARAYVDCRGRRPECAAPIRWLT